MVNLSGTWLGTYWQEGIPTRFELTLVQGGNVLSGNILDDSDLGEATLTGEVIGRRITFTKKYITTHGYSVAYTGIVSEDDNFMQGQWQSGWLSGTWEAYRSEDNLTLKLETRRRETVPVGV